MSYEPQPLAHTTLTGMHDRHDLPASARSADSLVQSLQNVRDQQMIALAVYGCAGPANVRLPTPVIRYNYH